MAKLRGTIAGVIANPDSAYTSQGKPFIKFSIPADSFKAGNKSTEWIRCTAWGERFEKMWPYLQKGKIVLVTGEISINSFKGRDDVVRTSLELNVFEIDLLGSTQSLANAQKQNAGAADESQWDISNL